MLSRKVVDEVLLCCRGVEVVLVAAGADDFDRHSLLCDTDFYSAIIRSVESFAAREDGRITERRWQGC